MQDPDLVAAFYLGNETGKPNSIHNDVLFEKSEKIKQVMFLAAEAEIAVLFINSMEAASLRQTLIVLIHPPTSTSLALKPSSAIMIESVTIPLHAEGQSYPSV
jgi:hypothetical protein